MKWLAGAVFGLGILQQLQPCYGFKIDESCHRPFGKKANDYKMVKKAMKNAFKMAEWAFDEVKKDGRDRDDQVNRLIRILFCKKGEDPKTAVLPHLRGILEGVVKLKGQTEYPDKTDVVVYCNTDRISEVKRSLNSKMRTLHYDSHSKTILDDPGSTMSECISKKDLTLAVTFSPARKDEIHGGEIHGNPQIQICRWFLEWSRDAKYKIWDDISKRAGEAGHLGIRWSTHGWPLTEVDAWTLFDKVMLHELTHANPINKAVDCHKGFSFPVYPFRTAYGWKAARALPKKKGYPFNDLETNQNIPKGYPGYQKYVYHGAQSNADSIALFGSALNLLRIPGSPKYVKLNGELTLTPPDHREGDDVDDLPMFDEDGPSFDTTDHVPEHEDTNINDYLNLLEKDYNQAQILNSDDKTPVTRFDSDESEDEYGIDHDDSDQNAESDDYGYDKSDANGYMRDLQEDDQNFEIEDDEEPDQEGDQGIEFAGTLGDSDPGNIGDENDDEPDQEGDQGVEFAGTVEDSSLDDALFDEDDPMMYSGVSMDNDMEPDQEGDQGAEFAGVLKDDN